MDVSIIIVNYNTKDLLKQCLESIRENVKDIEYEVIVTDNNSSDDSVEMLKREFQDVILIESSINGGFAYANNLAIKKSKGRYVFLLNSDTIIVGSVVQDMVKYMDENEWIGILGPELLNGDMTHQTSIAAFPSLFREFAHIFEFKKLLKNKLFKKIMVKFGDKLGSKNIEQYMKNFQNITQPERVQVVVGAAMLIRRKVIDEVGLLDERYFMYYEEIDYCLQAHKAGWPSVYWPHGQIIHLIGQSSKKVSAFTFYERYKSSIYYFRKNHGKIAEFFVRLNLIVGLSYRIIRDFIKKCFGNAEDYKTNAKIYKNTIKIALKRLNYDKH